MNGVEQYNEKYENKINNILKNNTDKTYLNGFVGFLIDSSNATIYSYLNIVVAFLDKTNKKVEDINLDDYVIYLHNNKKKTKSYQITIYAALKKFSTYLFGSHRNAENPMEIVNRPKFSESEKTKQKRENGYLTSNEIKEYMYTVKHGAGTTRSKSRQEEWKERDMLIVMIFLTTGIRCSALYKLNIDSIDIKNRKLITTDKGDVIKEFDLSNDIIEYVFLWIKKRNKILNGNKEEALFISNRKTRMDQSSISRVVNKYAENIDGKHITPHKLRATYGTTLYNETKDLYYVQQCMGHSNPKTTEIYIRGKRNEAKEKAANIMMSLI